ncbi:MAG: MGMT family protein [Candidatus Pacebacteria bacterium]|nr:MGMT family protein [Candidatus Paceibacterota bacterium]
MKLTFSEKVKSIVSKIPKGSMMTYKAVAKRAGSPNAARAVGAIMKANFDPKIPCHRVIRSDGIIGEYNRGGRDAKIKKLRAEGAIR